MLDLYKVIKKTLVISEKQIAFSITVTNHCQPNCVLTVILFYVLSQVFTVTEKEEGCLWKLKRWLSFSFPFFFSRMQLQVAAIGYQSSLRQTPLFLEESRVWFLLEIIQEIKMNQIRKGKSIVPLSYSQGQLWKLV